jgi:choline monooxygenase
MEGSKPITAKAPRSLPRDAYTSEKFFRAEMEHIHLRQWFFVGRADEMKSAGDFRAIDTIAGPVLLLRDRDGTLRAFANSCRHRGSLLLSGSGNCRAVVCPYHGWGYRLDGSLAGAPEMEKCAEFRPQEQGLIPIRLETWAGFIFLTLAADAPPLPETLGNLPEVFASHRLDDMVCTWRIEFDAKCNWKLLLENSMEAYHTGYIHARTVGAQTAAEIPTSGDWECIQVIDDRSIAVLGSAKPPFPPIEGLSEQARRGTYFSLIHPTTQFAVAQDSMWWLQVRPLSADRSILSIGGCFPRAITERADFAANAPLYYERWRKVGEEDVGMLEIQQLGLASILYQPGLLGPRETVMHRMDKWVLERLPESVRALT